MSKTEKISKTYKNSAEKVNKTIRKWPLFSFLGLLGILLGLIVINNQLSKNRQIEEVEIESVKQVKIYEIKESPYIITQSIIEKTGVVDILAQSVGVVQELPFKEGDSVNKNNQVAKLSTNYAGGNTQTLSRLISQKNYESISENLVNQIELLAIQKQIATESDDNAEDLAKIKNKSVDETKNLISINQEIVNELNEAIDESNSLSSQMQKSQYQSTLNGLKQSLRVLEYEIEGGNPTLELSGLQKDSTLKQLEIQEESLKLNNEVAKLQLNISRIQESLMFPSTPIAGTIQQIYVKEGDIVNPGDRLATISSDDISVEAIASVTADIARNISPISESSLFVNDNAIKVVPSFISSEATEGQLYSVIYNLDQESNDLVSNGQFIKTEIPIGFFQDGQIEIYIPLDSIFNTNTTSYVLINNDGIAVSKEVELGPIFGNFVRIESGLDIRDQIILNRNVVDGDLIEVVE